MRDRPLPQLTIQQLDYLVAVDEQNTWAEAAASLGVTPSALSQGLAELERRLGIRLFERTGRRRIIAASGRPVVDYARGVLARTGDLARWIDQSAQGAIGSLRLGMIDAAAIGHYPDVLRAFRADHPTIDFTLNVAPSADLLRDLEAGSLDLVVVVQPPTQPAGIQWSEVLVEPLAVYAPPDSAAGPPSTWGPWVSFAASSHTRQLVATAVLDAGAPFHVVAESNQPDVLRAMVRLGLGWTVLPVVQAESAPDPLVRALDRPLLTRTLVAATRRGAVDNPLAVELLAKLTN